MNSLIAILAVVRVFVSPVGTDGADGSAEHPVRTLGGARDALRTARTQQAAAFADGGAEVIFEDGRYVTAAPVELKDTDGGTAAAPVVWKARNRGGAVISGQLDLTDWQAVTNETVLALLGAEARTHVRAATIPGTEALPSFCCGGNGVPSNLQQTPLSVYCDGERLTQARWPNDGEYPVTGANSDGAATSKTGVFTYASDRLARWALEPDLWAFGLWTYEWADATVRVLGIDVGASRISVDPAPIHYGITVGAQFEVRNAFSEIDEPGEWVLDRTNRLLYCWLPREGADVSLAWATGLVKASGAANLHFKDLVFEYARTSAVILENAADCTVSGSTFRHTSSWGLEVTDGTNDCVVGCDLYDLGEGGIDLKGGVFASLTPANHVADNNHIHDYGQVIYNYRPGVKVRGVGNSVTHNLIHHTRHQAIQFDGNDHYLGFNVCHDCCRFNNDAGTIYCCQRDWRKRGTVIEHNLVHMTGKQPRGTHTEAIYLDDFSSGTIVRNNIINRAMLGVYVGGGQDNRIYGNLIFNCKYGLDLGSRGIETFGVATSGLGFKSSMFTTLNETLAGPCADLFRSRYPNMAKVLEFTDGQAAHNAHWNVMTNNLNVGCRGNQFENWENVGGTCTVTNNFETMEDPGVTCYDGLDWSFRPDGEAARRLGDLRFAEMGLYESPLRASPPVRFGTGLTRPRPFGREYDLATVRIDMPIVGNLPSGVTACATNVFNCEIASWGAGKRVVAELGQASFEGWKDYSFSFEPTLTQPFSVVVMGARGEKTLYDDIRIEGAALADGGFETVKDWIVPKTLPLDWSYAATCNSDRPWGIVTEAETGLSPAEGTNVWCGSDLIRVQQNISCQAGETVTVSFKARAAPLAEDFTSPTSGETGDWVVTGDATVAASGVTCSSVLFTGSGTIAGGSLAIGAGGITVPDDVADAVIACPIVLDRTDTLALTGAVAVRELWIGGVRLRAGTYGSSASSAAVKDDARFSGTGVVTVVEDDPTWIGASGDWSDANNWAFHLLPTADDTVHVSNTVGELVINIDSPTVTVKAIRFEGHSVTGDVTVTGGKLILTSSDCSFKSSPDWTGNCMRWDLSAAALVAYPNGVDFRVPVEFTSDTRVGIMATFRDLHFRKPVTAPNATVFRLHNGSRGDYFGYVTKLQDYKAKICFHDDFRAPRATVTPYQEPTGGICLYGPSVVADRFEFSDWAGATCRLMSTNVVLRTGLVSPMFRAAFESEIAGSYPTNTVVHFRKSASTGLTGWNSAVNLGCVNRTFDRLTSEALSRTGGDGYEIRSQTIRNVTSSQKTTGPTTLTLRGTADAVTEARIMDDITVVWDPVGNYTQAFSNRTHTTVGSFVAKGGTMKLAGAGSIASARSLEIAAGAAFELASTIADPLPRDLIVASTSKLKLNGATVRVKRLVVDGVAQADGTYAGEAWMDGAGSVAVAAGTCCTWIGTSGGSWSTAANWLGGKMPLSSSSVAVLDAQTSDDIAITIGTDVAAANFPCTLEIVNRGAGTTALRVAASVTVTNGAVRIGRHARVEVPEGGTFLYKTTQTRNASSNAEWFFRDMISIVDGGVWKTSGGTTIMTNYCGQFWVNGEGSKLEISGGLHRHTSWSSAYPICVGAGARLNLTGGTFHQPHEGYNNLADLSLRGGTADFSGGTYRANCTTVGSGSFYKRAQGSDLGFGTLLLRGTVDARFGDPAQFRALDGGTRLDWIVRDGVALNSQLYYIGGAEEVESTLHVYGVPKITGKVSDACGDYSLGGQYNSGDASGDGRLWIHPDGFLRAGVRGLWVAGGEPSHAYNPTCQRGFVRVDAGAALDVYGSAHRGYGASQGPNGLRIGGCARTTCTSGRPYRGRMVVAGLVTNRLNLVVGGWHGRGVYVQEDGETLTSTATDWREVPVVALGMAGGEGALLVSNGTFTARQNVWVGGCLTNAFVSHDGVQLAPNQFAAFGCPVDNHGAEGLLEVAGGTFVTTANLYVGADGTGVVSVVGSKGALCVGGDLVLSNRSCSVLRLTADANGLAPITVGGKLVLTEASSLEVDLRACPNLHRVRLFTLPDAVEGDFGSVRVTPGNRRLVRHGNDWYAVDNRGLSLALTSRRAELPKLAMPTNAVFIPTQASSEAEAVTDMPVMRDDAATLVTTITCLNKEFVYHPDTGKFDLNADGRPVASGYMSYHCREQGVDKEQYCAPGGSWYDTSATIIERPSSNRIVSTFFMSRQGLTWMQDRIALELQDDGLIRITKQNWDSPNTNLVSVQGNTYFIYWQEGDYPAEKHGKVCFDFTMNESDPARQVGFFGKQKGLDFRYSTLWYREAGVLFDYALWHQQVLGTNLTFTLDMRTGVKTEKTPHMRAGLDFKAIEDLEMPDDAHTNLTPNGSFECGLRGWAPSVFDGHEAFDTSVWDKACISVTTDEAKFGRRSLKLLSQNRTPSDLRNLGAYPAAASTPLYLERGTYTVSFWAKGDVPGVKVGIWFPGFRYLKVFLPKDGKLGNNGLFRKICYLTTDWREYSLTFDLTADDVTYAVLSTWSSSDDAHAFVDGFQLERGGAASGFRPPPAEARLVTSAPDNFCNTRLPLDAALEIVTAPHATGTVDVELFSFLDESIFRREYAFAADADGFAHVALDELDGAVPRGIFVMKRTFTVRDGAGSVETCYEHDRLTRLPYLETRYARWSRLFSSVYSYPDMLWNGGRLMDRQRRLGYTQYYKTVLDPAIYERKRRHGFSLGSAHAVNYATKEVVPDPDDPTKTVTRALGWGVVTVHQNASYRNTTNNTAEVKAYIFNHKTLGVPLDEDYLARFRAAVAAKVRDNPEITRWEFGNEFSANVPYSWWNDASDVEEWGREYAKYLKAYYLGVKDANPNAIVDQDAPWNMSDAGIAELRAWIKPLTESGVRLDGISFHTYRAAPENPDFETHLKTVLGILREYGYPDTTQLYFGEGMHWGPYEIPAWGLVSASWGGCPKTWSGNMALSYDIGQTERRSAAWRMRSWLVDLKYAPRIATADSGNTNNELLDYDLTPRLSILMPSTLTQLLGNSTFVEEIHFAAYTRAYVFRDPQKRPVVAVWNYKESVDYGKAAPPVASADFGDALEGVYDMVSTPRRFNAGRLEFPILPTPLFFRGKPGTLQQVVAAFKTAQVEGADAEDAYSIAGNPCEPAKTHITVRDNVTGETEDVYETIDPALTAEAPTAVSHPSYGIAYTGLIARQVAVGTALADVDWEALPSLPLTQAYGSPGTGFAASYRMGWNTSGIYLEVEVTDPVFSHVLFSSDELRWANDSLRVCIDTYADARASDETGYDDDDYDYSVFPEPDGSACRVFRHHQVDPQLGLATSAPADNTYADDIPTEFARTADGYVYRVHFPAKYLLPLALKKGTAVGFGLMANDAPVASAPATAARRTGALTNLSADGEPADGNPHLYPAVLLWEGASLNFKGSSTCQ